MSVNLTAGVPADEAPVPCRGAQSREVFVMRFLALARVIRALVLFAAAYGIWTFEGVRDAVQRAPVGVDSA